MAREDAILSGFTINICENAIEMLHRDTHSDANLLSIIVNWDKKSDFYW